MKRWFVLAAAASALVVFGPELVESLGWTARQDMLSAFAIALLMQPWIIHHLEN